MERDGEMEEREEGEREEGETKRGLELQVGTESKRVMEDELEGERAGRNERGRRRGVERERRDKGERD